MRIILLSALLTVSAYAQSRAAAPRATAPAPRTIIAPPSGRGRPMPALPPVKRPVTVPPAPRNYYPPRTIVAPYPIFVGGGYYSGYTGAPAGQDPVGIVNPNFQPDGVNPQIVDFSNVPLAEPAMDSDQPGDQTELRDDQPTIFLIALTDHTVLASIAYWADGDTLNWVSRDAKQNHISLSLVDREFSKQLNDERHVEFKLPPAQ